ncbi:hypothetical protein EVAR_15103_1 [Eumeta japonica]|uniref:Uncharacterized protein n=1 Tax=Eumeta variegata TaxID=151549 RepID=A0A4C1UIV4_EUMVA|nr:hypothetical protein EVAR_15103_1 [Eumeta japonica]
MIALFAVSAVASFSLLTIITAVLMLRSAIMWMRLIKDPNGILVKIPPIRRDFSKSSVKIIAFILIGVCKGKTSRRAARKWSPPSMITRNPKIVNSALPAFRFFVRIRMSMEEDWGSGRGVSCRDFNSLGKQTTEKAATTLYDNTVDIGRKAIGPNAGRKLEYRYFPYGWYGLYILEVFRCCGGRDWKKWRFG